MDKKCGAKKVVGSDKNTLRAFQTAQIPHTIEKYNHTCTNRQIFLSQLLRTFFHTGTYVVNKEILLGKSCLIFKY